MDHQLHRLALLEIAHIFGPSYSSSRLSHFILSSRVRQIGGGSSRTRKPNQNRRTNSMSLASMEPRSLERGNPLRVITIPVRPLAASMEPRSLERGNPATQCLRTDIQNIASMEPRSLERGNLANRRVQYSASSRLQWSRVLSNAETRERETHGSPRERFNGAAFSRTRKPDIPHPCQLGLCRLQWSRVLSNAETHAKHELKAHILMASMEPRSLERGNHSCPSVSVSAAGCFNGAAFSRTRNMGLPDARPVPSQASMEPRSLERGNQMQRIAGSL